MAAGNPLCSAHGLRKALATLMANSGKSPDEIRAVMAHKTNKESSTYTKKADVARLADSGLSGLLSTETEQKLSNLPLKLDATTLQPFERKHKND
jgi:integrase